MRSLRLYRYGDKVKRKKTFVNALAVCSVVDRSQSISSSSKRETDGRESLEVEWNVSDRCYAGCVDGQCERFGNKGMGLLPRVIRMDMWIFRALRSRLVLSYPITRDKGPKHAT